MTKPPKISFFVENLVLPLKQRKKLKEFIGFVFSKEKKRVTSLNFIFCSDEFLLNINRQFLSHDFYTDIVTFDLSKEKDAIVAEAYISLDRVRENAKKENVLFLTELHRVVFHGVLHLCGYKDKRKIDIEQMRKKENNLLGLYFKK